MTTLRTASAWPVALPFVRVSLVGAGAAATMAALALAGRPAGLAAASTLAVLYLLPVPFLI